MLAGQTLPNPLPDVIIHLEVWQDEGFRGVSPGDEMMKINVDLTRQWLDWAARQGVRRFVFLSSIMAVSPGPGKRFEDALPETSDTYGGSKARAEALVREWALGDAHRIAVILRPAPVYGPDEGTNLEAFVRRVIAGRPSLLGAGLTLRSVVSRANLGAAVAFCLARAELGCTVYNVTDAVPLSSAELAATVASVAAAPRPRSVPMWLARLFAPVGDAVSAVLGRGLPISSARLREATTPTDFPCERLLRAGFVHPQSTREGLEELVAWVRKQPPTGRR